MTGTACFAISAGVVRELKASLHNWLGWSNVRYPISPMLEGFGINYRSIAITYFGVLA